MFDLFSVSLAVYVEQTHVDIDIWLHIFLVPKFNEKDITQFFVWFSWFCNK